MSRNTKIIAAVAAVLLLGLVLYFLFRRKPATSAAVAEPQKPQPKNPSGVVSDLSNGLDKDLQAKPVSTGYSGQLPGYPSSAVALPVSPAIYTQPISGTSPTAAPAPIQTSPSQPVSSSPDAGNTSINPVTQTGSR